MTYNEYIIGKCAIIDWNQYKKIAINSFVLDEEMQIEQLEEALHEISKLDNNMMVYASTYPIEKNENGIGMFSDMLWIKTKLSVTLLEELFSKYRQIEPSAVFALTEEEKGHAELYIDTGFQSKEFAIVSDAFNLEEIKVLYWD